MNERRIPRKQSMNGKAANLFGDKKASTAKRESSRAR